MKDAIVAVIALFAIMLYVEVRLTELNKFDGDQYIRVGMAKSDNNGDILYFPVYRRLTK